MPVRVTVATPGERSKGSLECRRRPLRPRKTVRVASSYTQLWFWVLIAIAAGILFGIVAPETAEKAKWLADAFIQIIQAITGPVIFVTVMIGIASIGSLARAGGLAVKALAYFFAMTVTALALGLIVGNIVAPGSGFEGEPDDAARATAEEEIGEAGEQGLVPFITDNVLRARSCSRSWRTRSCAS